MPPPPPPPIVPPFAPESAKPKAFAPKSLVATSRTQGLVSATSFGRHSEREWELYTMIKKLRADGFTCPGGKHFRSARPEEFKFDCRLFRASRYHSEDMGVNAYFSHISPEGFDPFDRSFNEGLGTFYELISAPDADANSTLAKMKEDNAQCEAVMTMTHTRIGVGHAHVQASPYFHYWTLLLAADEGAVDTSCYLVGAGEAPPPRGCIDSNVDCATWKDEGFCEGAYRNYMRQTCPISCDLCGPREDHPTTPAPCLVEAKDLDINCHFWAGLGHCEEGNENAEMMRETCPKSCGFCG